MSQPNTIQTDDPTRARAELERMAAEQGVRPLSFDELLGDGAAGDPDKEDIDDFLALRRELREHERARSRG